MTANAEGYFTDDSMIRIIHRERALVLMGPRALLMQAAHPVAVVGLVGHSDSLDDPYRRLERTAEVMDAISFGSRAEADRLTKTVRQMHGRISGELKTAVGPYPAGTPYRADDPELLMWVLFTLVDSGLVVFQTYVRRLSKDEQARYWDDYKVVGHLFGLKPHEMPATLDDLREYKRDMLTGGKLFVNDWARTRAKQIVLSPPMPLYTRPLIETVNFITIALLPNEIRSQYGFASLPPVLVRKAMVAGGAEYVKRAVVPLLPERWRYVPSAQRAA